ncbi:MAG: porin [Rikenellaceae bacterium]
MIKKITTLLCLSILCSSALYAQQTETKSSESEQESETSVDLTPQLFGSVRAKYEQSTETDLHRFNVRNSRLGVKGNTSESMSYQIQIDFNNEGSISILDSYVTYNSGNFKFSLGQQQYHFNADLDRGPSSSLFSNRSFLSKYLTTYYNETTSKTIGSRDIGAIASYKLPTTLPVSIMAGLMNGSGANNPEWTQSVNFVGRLTVGDQKGLQGAASYYTGTTPYAQDIMMYGAELRYAGQDYLIESAFAERKLEQDGTQTLTAAHVHGYYNFHIDKCAAIEYLAPHLRWDVGNGIEFVNQQSLAVDRFDANRITVALNIGFAKKWIGSEIRLAYEEYLVGSSHTDSAINPLLQDKYTIEFIASF